MEILDLIEGVDYFVRSVQFPNGANPGAVFVNPDGTYDIYLNTLYTDLSAGYEHEVRHLLLDHFYAEDKSITELEAEADGVAPQIEQPEPKTRVIPLYSSLSALRDYLLPTVDTIKSKHPEIKFA